MRLPSIDDNWWDDSEPYSKEGNMLQIPNGDEPAFPCECDYSAGAPRGVQTGSYRGVSAGLTKREYFAAMAMQGMLANRELIMSATSIGAMCDIGAAAWQMADAVLNRQCLAEIEQPPVNNPGK